MSDDNNHAVAALHQFTDEEIEAMKATDDEPPNRLPRITLPVDMPAVKPPRPAHALAHEADAARLREERRWQLTEKLVRARANGREVDLYSNIASEAVALADTVIARFYGDATE